MNKVTKIKSSKLEEFSIFCWNQKDRNKESKVCHKFYFLLFKNTKKKKLLGST